MFWLVVPSLARARAEKPVSKRFKKCQKVSKSAKRPSANPSCHRQMHTIRNPHPDRPVLSTQQNLIPSVPRFAAVYHGALDREKRGSIWSRNGQVLSALSTTYVGQCGIAVKFPNPRVGHSSPDWLGPLCAPRGGGGTATSSPSRIPQPSELKNTNLVKFGKIR